MCFTNGRQILAVGTLAGEYLGEHMGPLVLRRTFLAGSTGTLAMWVAAYLWHHTLLADFYVENLFPGNGFGTVSVPFLLLGYSLLGFSMAWVAPRLASVGPLPLRGLRFGLTVGFLAVAPMTFMIYAAGEATGRGVAVDLSWHLLVEQPFGGVVIVWTLARGAAQPSSSDGG